MLLICNAYSIAQALAEEVSARQETESVLEDTTKARKMQHQ